MDPQNLLTRIRWNAYHMGEDHVANRQFFGEEYDKQADEEFLKIADQLKEAREKIKRLESIIDNSTKEGIAAIFKLAEDEK